MYIFLCLYYDQISFQLNYQLNQRDGLKLELPTSIKMKRKDTEKKGICIRMCLHYRYMKYLQHQRRKKILSFLYYKM